MRNGRRVNEQLVFYCDWHEVKQIQETYGKAMSGMAEGKKKLWWCSSFKHIDKMLSKNVKIHRNMEKSIDNAQERRSGDPITFLGPALPLHHFHGNFWGLVFVLGVVFFALHAIRASLAAVLFNSL